MKTSTTSALPIAASERIIALDVLRGFALLGILIMNIQLFSMPEAAYFNPTAYGDLEGVNRWVWMLGHVFADHKFMTLFSLLFGAGILLLTERLASKNRAVKAIYFRRNVWLLVFGLVHAYFFWMGDILTMYALCAFVVFFFRKLKAKWLTTIAITLFMIPTLLMLSGGAAMSQLPDDAFAAMLESWQPGQESIQAELKAYRGSWLMQMEKRVPQSLTQHSSSFLFWGFWRISGLMLLGMALYKWDVLTAKRSRRFYLGLVAVGVVGLVIIAYGVHENFAADWAFTYSRFGVGYQFNYWGSFLVAFGYIGLITLFARSGVLRWLQRGLAAVGRTALSNYLFHTLVCTALFYGHGFGLYGSVDRLGQALIVVAIWLVQIILSVLWLRQFRFGPAEWLWRSLTYGKAQAMRLGKSEGRLKGTLG